jgi:hypothetical protein
MSVEKSAQALVIIPEYFCQLFKVKSDLDEFIEGVNNTSKVNYLTFLIREIIFSNPVRNPFTSSTKQSDVIFYMYFQWFKDSPFFKLKILKKNPKHYSKRIKAKLSLVSSLLN